MNKEREALNYIKGYLERYSMENSDHKVVLTQSDVQNMLNVIDETLLSSGKQVITG